MARAAPISPVLLVLVAALLLEGSAAAAPAHGRGRPRSVAEQAAEYVALMRRRAATPVPGLGGVTMGELVDRYRREVMPWCPMPVLLAFIAHESSGRLNNGFADATWKASFYELNLFQVPGGKSYYGANPGAPQYPPPGPGVEHTAWGRICHELGYDPQAWSAPVAGVHVGLVNLRRDHDHVRRTVPDLFSRPGTDWDIRCALLFAFSRGAGATISVLRAAHDRLRALPEDERWPEFAETAPHVQESYHHGVTSIIHKVELARQLGYVPEAA